MSGQGLLLVHSFFPTLSPLEGLILSTFRGVCLIHFCPLENTQREMILETEACGSQGKDHYVTTPPTILVLPSFPPSLSH